MKNGFGLFALALTVGVAGCGVADVEQTKEGEMPEVDVKSGTMPEFKADVADVDVGTKTETIEVPTLSVDEADASKADGE